MRERVKYEIISCLENFSGDDLKKISLAIDTVLNKYEISKRSTDLIVYNLDLPEECRVYLAVKKVDGLSMSTLKSYYHILRKFFMDVRIKPQDVSTNDITLWLYKNNVSSRSLDTYLTIIKGFFSWAFENEYISKDPCKKIGRIKYTPHERKPLTQDQMEIIRVSCKTKREKALIEFLYSTACRISEAANVTMKDIDFQTRTVYIRHGKGDKDREVYLNSRAMLALNEYINSRTFKSNALFASHKLPHNNITKEGLEKEVKAISKRCGIEFVSHQIRHTVATQMLSSGAPIETISKYLGHTNVQTTLIYAHRNVSEVRREHNRCII